MPHLKETVVHWLRWSEKYTKTDMVYLTKGGGSLLLYQAASTLVAFGLSVAFATYVSKEVYGTYKFALATIAILGSFGLTGLNTAIIPAVARGKEDSLSRGFRLSIKWGMLSVVLALLVGAYYWISGDRVLALCFVVASVTWPLFQAARLYIPFLEGKRAFGTEALYGIVQLVLPTIAILLTMALTEGALTLVVAYLTSNVVVALCIYVYIQKPRATRSLEDDRILTKYSLKLSGIQLLNVVAGNIDRLLIFHYLGAAQLAIYSFAIAIPDQLKGVFQSVAQLALPKFAISTLEKIRASLPTKLMRMGGLALLVTILYVLVAPFVYHTFFPAYAESISLSQIYALGLASVILFVPLSAFKALEKAGTFTIYTVTTSVLGIALLFIFIYQYGLLGAIIARVITKFVSLGIALFLLYARSNGPSEA